VLEMRLERIKITDCVQRKELALPIKWR